VKVARFVGSAVRAAGHLGVGIEERGHARRGSNGLVGGIGEYEHIWRMAYVRGPEGIIVSLAERIG
jgi:hypothetical protein